jgi:hypothetical protein
MIKDEISSSRLARFRCLLIFAISCFLHKYPNSLFLKNILEPSGLASLVQYAGVSIKKESTMDDALKDIRRLIDQWFFRLMAGDEAGGPGEGGKMEIERLAIHRSSIAGDVEETNDPEETGKES